MVITRLVGPALLAFQLFGCTAGSSQDGSKDTPAGNGGSSGSSTGPSAGGSSGGIASRGGATAGTSGVPGYAGTANGGASSGGAPPGGASSGGVSPGGASSGGVSPGGASSGGVSSGGAADAGTADSGASPDAVTRYGDFTGVCGYGKDAFAALQTIGIKNVRFDRPSSDIITTARTYGIEILPILDYGYTDLSGQNDQMYPPLPQNLSTWSKRMVDLYRTMPSPPKVLEVWNEPWNTGFWKPKPDAAAYLALFKAFAAEAWSVWPKETLLVSADEGEAGYAFRKELLKADTTGFLNDPRILPTTHNYVEGRTPTEVTSQPCSWDLNRFDCAWNDFKTHGHPNPQVWLTEFGWESNTPGGTNAVTPVTEAVQASNTVEALKIFRSSGHVAKAYAFLFKNNDSWNYNWLRPDNSQKPVCQSVKTLIATGN